MQITPSGQLAKLHQFILKTFATIGQSPTLSSIQQQFLLSSEEETDQLLLELEQTKAIHRVPGDSLVTHAYPFSNVPTTHRVTLASGVQVNAMCAVDALGIPLMLNTDGRIDSECLQCQQSIHVDLKDGKVSDHTPGKLRVGYVSVGCCSTPATEQCPHINFFCSQEHLETWAKNNPEHELKFLTLEQGLEQGQRIFGSLMKDLSESCCQ